MNKPQIDRFYNKYENSKDLKKGNLKLSNKNGIHIFPFEIKFGSINQTETGIVDDKFTIDSFSTYKKLFTGLTNLNAL